MSLSRSKAEKPLKMDQEELLAYVQNLEDSLARVQLENIYLKEKLRLVSRRDESSSCWSAMEDSVPWNQGEGKIAEYLKRRDTDVESSETEPASGSSICLVRDALCAESTSSSSTLSADAANNVNHFHGWNLPMKRFLSQSTLNNDDMSEATDGIVCFKDAGVQVGKSAVIPALRIDSCSQTEKLEEQNNDDPHGTNHDCGNDGLIVHANSRKSSSTTARELVVLVKTEGQNFVWRDLDLAGPAMQLYDRLAYIAEKHPKDYIKRHFIVKLYYEVLRPEDNLERTLSQRREALFVVPATDDWFFGDFLHFKYVGLPYSMHARDQSDKIAACEKTPLCPLRDFKRGRWSNIPWPRDGEDQEGGDVCPIPNEGRAAWIEG